MVHRTDIVVRLVVDQFPDKLVVGHTHLLCHFFEVFLEGHPHGLYLRKLFRAENVLKVDNGLVDRVAFSVVSVKLVKVGVVVVSLAHRFEGYGEAVVGGGGESFEHRRADEFVNGSGDSDIVHEEMVSGSDMQIGIVVGRIVVEFNVHFAPPLVGIDRKNIEILYFLLSVAFEIEASAIIICTHAHHHGSAFEVHIFCQESLAEERDLDCAGIVHLRSVDVGGILRVDGPEACASAGLVHAVACPLRAVGERGVDEF